MTTEPGGEIILYRREDGSAALEVRLEADTVWLTQSQIAELFQTSRQNVNLHLQHIYAERELVEEATCKDLLQVRSEGSREVRRTLRCYNLDAIISVGYLVKSRIAAAHGHTAAEVIAQRADADRRDMGLTTYPGERPCKADVTVAKNYLDETELRKLNTLVSAYFDAVEFRAQNHEPTYMADWLRHLERLIAAMDAPLLQGPRRVSHEQAVAHAHAEYAKYRLAQRDLPTGVERAYLDTIKQAQREIEGKK